MQHTTLQERHTEGELTNSDPHDSKSITNFKNCIKINKKIENFLEIRILDSNDFSASLFWIT